MLRLLSCFTLYITLSASQIVPYGPTPVPLPGPFARGAIPAPFARGPVPGPFVPGLPGIPPVVPTVYPFGPTPRPLVPGAYNNPYYNGAGAPAVPIVTYSSDHVGDGTYSFR